MLLPKRRDRFRGALLRTRRSFPTSCTLHVRMLLQMSLARSLCRRKVRLMRAKTADVALCSETCRNVSFVGDVSEVSFDCFGWDIHPNKRHPFERKKRIDATRCRPFRNEERFVVTSRVLVGPMPHAQCSMCCPSAGDRWTTMVSASCLETAIYGSIQSPYACLYTNSGRTSCKKDQSLFPCACFARWKHRSKVRNASLNLSGNR